MTKNSDNRRVKRFSRLKAISLCLFLSVSQVFSQDANVLEEGPVPQLLKGVWENYNRYVVFDTGYTSADGGAIPQIVLRTFYQWYDDRAAESPEYSKAVKRDTNIATQNSSEAQEIHIRFVPLTEQLFTSDYGMPVVQSDGDVLYAEDKCSGAWDLQIEYKGKKLGGKKIYHVPVAVIGDKLYLNFKIKVDDSDSVPVSPLLDGNVMERENFMAGYWMDYGNANGILESAPVESTELLSYFVTDSVVYPIRYWVTDMEYDENAIAAIIDGPDTYYVPKHLWIGDQNYTCTLGRRTQIRNLQKIDSLPGPYETNSVLVEKHAVDSQGKEYSYTVRTATICAFGEPYLTLTDGARTIEQIIKDDNSRRKDPPPPLFPPHGVLDFDWSIIERPPKDFNRRMLDLGK